MKMEWIRFGFRIIYFDKVALIAFLSFAQYFILCQSITLSWILGERKHRIKVNLKRMNVIRPINSSILFDHRSATKKKTLRHWDAVRWTEFGWLSFGVLDQKQRVWFRSKAATKFEIKNGLRLEINECQKRVGDASDMVGIIILSGWTSLPKSSAIRNGIDLIAYYRFSAIQSDEDNYFIILFFAWAATGFWLRFLFGKI